MDAPRRQPSTPPQPPRRKPARVIAARRAAVPARRHVYGLPDVREIPRRPAGGPWESGW